MQSAPSVRVLRRIGEPGRAANWRQVVPTHRLPVASKTTVLVAVGAYISGSSLSDLRVWLSMAFASLLWTVLYILNEATDVEAEQGLFVQPLLWRSIVGLLWVLCLGAAFVSPLLSLLLSLMFLGQWAYCAPPFRLKRYWWAILVLSGVLNPLLRLWCGAIWGGRQIPLLVYIVVISLHLGATLRARSLQKSRDKMLAYSTAPFRVDIIGRLCTVLGFSGSFVLCFQGVLPPIFTVFILLCLPFSVYAWSSRAQSMRQLRRFWAVFALLAFVAICALLAR